MSRQTQSIFTSATQATGIAPVPASSIEGVTKDFSTLEIRATLKAGRRNQTLFTFHGGSVMKSKKNNLFTAFMLRPFLYSKGEESKELMVNKETGELQHSSLKCLLVKAVESSIPEAIKPLISMLAATPAEQREVAIMVASQTLKIGQEEVVKYLYQTDSLEHQEISPSKFLNNLFKHENVRFKANISSKWETKIESIIERISGGEDKYSIVLRFDLTKVNAIKELVELQAYNETGELEARRHPLTNDVILLQEVSIPLTYIGIEKGSTYDEDTTKYLNPMLSINAAKSATKDLDNPVYMDYSLIEARAEKVNAWKETLATTTGKKFLKNSGVLEKLYDELVFKVANQDEKAKTEADSIFEALASDDRISEVKLTEMKATFERKVQEAANQPEPSENKSTSESTQQGEDNQEETVISVTDNAVDMLSSPAFSLDALLGMNLAIDEE